MADFGTVEPSLPSPGARSNFHRQRNIMTRMTKLVPMVGALALTFSLTACSGGSDYCDALEDSNDTVGDLAELDPNDSAAIDDAIAAFQTIADLAPDELDGDWDRFMEVFALAQDPENIQNPDALDEVDIESFQESAAKIERHALDECGVDIT